ncbi:efflux RND transporter periplasmic adaptor subunit [Sphingorhabdus sp.]|jgi:RND family efflux transporter MFP subunit|uniref:efflux RND transporter periplasmic adaptor subunit n=1 Tax=Sphingorhabdus sp. TaxID=1902408 RepID=UPI0037C5028C
MNFETTISTADGYVGSGDLDETKKRRNIAVALVVVIALAVAVYYFFFAGSGADAGAEGKQSQAQTVSVLIPGNGVVEREINATGILAARREIPVGVVGEGGQVSRVYVDAGDWVQQGQVLASIERSVQIQQIAGMQAQINAARADLNLAQNELDRALQLVERGFVSKTDVDRKTANRDSARARLGVADAQLREMRARTARLDIRAPVGGFVLERNVETGQTVGQGSGMLFRLAQGGEFELQAQLGEADLADLSTGVTASVTPVGTERVFNGTIWQIAPMINEQTRQGIARISLPFDRALKPGGFANVEIKAGSTTAPLLPESAVQNDQKGSYVYLIDAKNKVVRREVKIGDVTPNGLIIQEGLTGNERVVAYAGGFLNPDETVNPRLVKPSAIAR